MSTTGREDLSWPVRDAIAKIEKTMAELSAELRLTRQRVEFRQDNHETICEKDREEQSRWRDSIDEKFEKMGGKMDSLSGDLRNSFQSGLSMNNVAIASIGDKVRDIELERAGEKGQIKGGMAVISAISAAAGLAGSALTLLVQWASGHMK